MVGGVTSASANAVYPGPGAAQKTAGPQRDGSSAEQAEQTREAADLKTRDAEVRRHEQAHQAAGGQYVRGAARYTYERGPDGRMYAVGGEVSIDVSPGRTPEETLEKAQAIRRAALAPAQPSGQDRAVAARAAAMEADARRQMSAAYGKTMAAGGAPGRDGDSSTGGVFSAVA